MLQTLMDRNLFVEEFSTDMIWYRYHQLFHEFLAFQLSSHVDTSDTQLPGTKSNAGSVHLDRDIVLNWHQRAAQWYASAGQAAQEIQHLLKAGQVESAAERMAATIGDLYVDGRYVEVIRLLTSLPNSTLWNYPYLLHRLSGAYEAVGNMDKAIEASNQAIAGFELLADGNGLAEALIGRGTWYRIVGEIELAITDTRRALGLTDDDASRARANRNLGQCFMASGELAKAETALKEALACALSDGNLRVIAHTHSDLSMLYQLMGDTEGGIDHALSAVDYWRELGRSGGLALALNNLATAYHAQGRRQEAEQQLREAVRQARLAGIRRLEALALIGLADVAADRDDFQIAESLYARGIRLLHNSRIVALHIYGLAMWAETLRLKGDLEQAFQRLMEARVHLTRRSSAYEAALVSHVRGALALDRGDLTRSARHLDDATRRFEQLGTHRETVRALLYRVVVSERLHHQAEADRLMERAELLMERTEQHAVFEVDLTRVSRYRGTTHLHEVGKPDRWVKPTATSPFYVAGLDTIFEQLGGQGASTRLAILALGAPIVMRDGEPLEQRAWETVVARDLFFYLMEHPSGCTSGELMLAFWPDSSPKRAKSALHSSLSRIRRALGKNIIGVSANRYYVSRSETLGYDVDVFATAVKRAHAATSLQAKVDELSNAVMLVRGEYLDGVLSEWCIERRWSIEREVTSAMLSLADAHLQAGQCGQAATVYQNIVERDPLGEVAYQGLMRAFAAQGDRASALRVYEKLANLLGMELGVDPDPQTAALYDLIRARRE